MRSLILVVFGLSSVLIGCEVGIHTPAGAILILSAAVWFATAEIAELVGWITKSKTFVVDWKGPDLAITIFRKDDPKK